MRVTLPAPPSRGDPTSAEAEVQALRTAEWLQKMGVSSRVVCFALQLCRSRVKHCTPSDS